MARKGRRRVKKREEQWERSLRKTGRGHKEVAVSVGKSRRKEKSGEMVLSCSIKSRSYHHFMNHECSLDFEIWGL